jgi:hypothetical protein
MHAASSESTSLEGVLADADFRSEIANAELRLAAAEQWRVWSCWGRKPRLRARRVAGVRARDDALPTREAQDASITVAIRVEDPPPRGLALDRGQEEGEERDAGGRHEVADRSADGGDGQREDEEGARDQRRVSMCSA